MRAKITKRTIDALQPGERDAFIWDTELPGFGCKITPKGSRVYLLQYGRAGRDRRITIGRHGIDVTPERARQEALRLRGLVATGNDPAAGRVNASETITVSDLARRYINDYAIPHKKPSGLAQDQRNLDNHVVPLIGQLALKSVERADVARAMRDVAAGRTAKDEKTRHQGRRIVRGGEIVANRVHALLSKMFALAEDWQLRAPGTNPSRGVKRFQERKVERFLSSEELSRLGPALAAEGKCSAALALRLMLLTGCRVGEVLSLQWRYVDQERRLLLLPDSKTGAKSVFLSQPAIDLLQSVKRALETDYVVQGDRPSKPLVSIRKRWKRVCTAAKLNNVRLHDLRHSFASVGAASGLSLPVIGALLGHSQPSTTARYAHLAASPLHSAADAIASRILLAMGEPRQDA